MKHKFKRDDRVRIKPGAHEKYERVKPEDKFPGFVRQVKKGDIIEVAFLDEETVDATCEGEYWLDVHADDLIPTE